MIDFPTLYPNLVKYLPNWSERFYPSLAQFARGEGYPCGNKGVFIPRRNKCWTHPKTGNRLTKPLTYQKYQEAKEKSQKSRTEKGRTALQDREQGFRDKARERVKGWQNKKVETKPTLANEAKMRDTLKKTIAENELNKDLAETAYQKYHEHQNGMKRESEGLSSRSVASLYKIPHATAVARINGLRESVGLERSNAVSVDKELGERINNLLNDGKQIKINSSGGGLRGQKKEPSQTTIDADKKWSDFLESKNVTEKGLRKLDPETRKKITEEFENIRIEERAQESSKRKGLSLPEEPKQTPNSTGVKGAGGKSVDQQYKDIIASSKDPKGTEEVLSSALRGGFGDFERKNYNEYSTAIKSGTVPKGMGNYYQKQVDKYKPIIDAEDFINERKKKAISGDYETEQEAGVYVLNKLKQKGYKEHEYYDSPDYEKDYGKLVGVMKSVKLPPPLSGIVPGKELKQTLTPGDKLLVKEDTYSLMSSGNTPTGYRIVDGGEVLKVNIKNVKTRVRGEYMGKPYENEPSLALDKVTHVIRDGKRYKVDDSDSSPNDLGIIEKAKPKTGSAREMAGGKKQKSRVEQMLDGYRETSDENIKKTISYLRKSAADLESDGTRLGSSIKQRKSEEFLSDAEQLENYLKKRTKKNNFNSNLKLAQFGGNNLRRLKSKLANFAKPGCCCEASKPLRRRKTKQTPRLKRRGNRYA